MSKLTALLVAVANVGIISGRNIVHIVIDDLRTELGAYNPGHPMFTPAMDQLAAEGVTFNRAYAQQAVCNPSRASFMTGRRPDSTGVSGLLCSAYAVVFPASLLQHLLHALVTR